MREAYKRVDSQSTQTCERHPLNLLIRRHITIMTVRVEGNLTTKQINR